MDVNLKKIIPFLKPYKGNVFWNITFNVLYALFSTLSFIALIPMLEVLFKDAEQVLKKPTYTSIWDLANYGTDYLYFYITKLTNENGAQYALLLVITIIISTFLLKNLFNYLALNHLLLIKNGVLRDLRTKMFDKVVSLPVAYYSEKRKGDVMSRMLNDVNEVRNSFFNILELVVKEPLTIIFTIGAMIAISFKLTLFVFIFIPISGFIITKIGKTLKAKSKKAQDENGYLISITEETLSGLKVIKSYNSENKFTKKFNDSLQRLYRLTNSIGRRNNLSAPMSEFMGVMVITILLWYGGNMVLTETFADGTPLLEGSKFLAYMALSYNILTPAKVISKASYQVKSGLAAAERVFEVLEVKSTIIDKPDAKAATGFMTGISLENVSFKYEDDYVLKNFSLNVPKGKSIALVGQSGSGKSTIANLLTRFYDVNDGSIKIDGDDIRDLETKSLRNLMGLVTQDSILFNDSVKNNILIGKENATDDEIIEALKIANAWEFVKSLPNGMDTNIGDAGGKLSGGQKQRLSIARAVLKNPPIMILDEATSALDTESERLVQDALENMMKNRTSIIIAHRLSTIQSTDEIIVMNKGEIAEQGKHQELITKNGIYKKLVDMQSFE